MLSIDGASPKSQQSGAFGKTHNLLWLWKRVCTLVVLPLWIGLSVLILVLQFSNSHPTTAEYDHHMADLTKLARKAANAERKNLFPKAAKHGTPQFEKMMAERQAKISSPYNPSQLEAFKEALKENQRLTDAHAAQLAAQAKCAGKDASTFAGKTVSLKMEFSYTYFMTFGPGGHIQQKPYRGRGHLLGNHGSYHGMQEVFINGDSLDCGRHARRTTVTFSFGDELRLLKAFEPQKCVYELQVQFPTSVCEQVTTTSTKVKLPRFPGRLRQAVKNSTKKKPWSPTVDFASVLRARAQARRQEAASMPAKLPSLVWMAPFYAGGGYSSEAISYMLGLQSIYKERKQQLGLREFAEHPNPDFQSGLPGKVANSLGNLERTGFQMNSWDVAVCHATPDVWLEDGAFGWGMLQKCPPDGTGLSVGRTMYETDRLPKDWTWRINQLDEVWVPSKFAVQQFASSGVESDKIVVMPEAVETNFFDPAKHEPLSNKDPDKFSFISVFKWEKRKGWDVLLRAFFEEFSAEDPVQLLVKTNVFYEGDFRDQVSEYAGSLTSAKEPLASYKILDNQVPLEQLPRLYLIADAFVIPTRGEGWGRPIVEAMSMGLPVIATNWSGPTEFLTKNNSLPLKIDGLSPVEGGAAGHQWAEPSVSHLRQLMRWVTENREDAAKLGAQARRDMVERYSPEVVVRDHLLPQLERIAQRIADDPLKNKHDSSPSGGLNPHPQARAFLRF